MIDRLALLMDDDDDRDNEVAGRTEAAECADPAHRMLTVSRKLGLYQIYNVRAKNRRSGGVMIVGEVAEGHHAYVDEYTFIRLHGINSNRVDGAAEYRRTFHVGDRAEYHSYNLSYIGTITGITNKTVTIQPDGQNEKKRRLSIYEFSWRNRDFNEAEAKRRNTDTMRHI